MPALADPTTWRTGKPYSFKAYLFILQPTIVFSGLVNQSSFAYPLTSITVDNTTGSASNVKSGMLLTLGTSAGGYDLGRQRIISAASTTLTIKRTSQGINDGELNPSDNVHFTVLDFRPVWAKIPHITAKGVTFKDGNIAYGATTTAQRPVANAGVAAIADFVDEDDSTLTKSFTNASYAVASGASIASHAWVFPNATPSSSSSANPSDIAFDPGFRYVEYTVTDSAGRTHTTCIPVYAAERTGSNAPLTNFEISSLVSTPEGQRATFKVYEDIDASDYPYGTLVLCFQEEFYGSTKANLTGSNLVFVGWLDKEPTTIAAEDIELRKETTLECLDVAGRLAKLPGFSEYVRRTGNARWETMPNADIWRLFVYTLQEHSTAIDVAPLAQSSAGTTYPFYDFAGGAQTLYQQADYIARAIGYRFTCGQAGTLRFLPDPMLLASGSRTSTVIVDIDETDWREMSYAQDRAPRQHWLRGEAIIAGTTSKPRTAFCMSPGTTPGQGAGNNTQGQQLVVSQTELNTRIGNAYQRANANQSEFDITLAHGGNAGIDPALMEWVRATISSTTAAQRGFSFTDARFLPLRLETRFSKVADTWVKDVTVTAEKETVGTAAVTYVPPTQPRTPEITLPKTSFPNTWNFPVAPVPQAPANMAVFSANGSLYRTSDFQTPAYAGGPTWTTTALTLNGTAISFTVDAFSPLYIGTGTTVNGWLVTTTKIYRVTDVLGTVGLTDPHTFADTVTAAGGAIRRIIRASIAQSGWVVVSSYNTTGNTGVRTAYTTDGGTTWTEVQVTSHTRTDQGVTPTLAVSNLTPGLAYAGAFTATGSDNSATSNVYKTTDHGATWGVASGSDPAMTNDRSVGHCFHLPYASNPDQNILIWTDNVASNNKELTRSIGSSEASVSPAGGPYGANALNGGNAINTCAVDQNIAVGCLWSQSGESSATVGVYVTRNFMDSSPLWTEIVAQASGSGGTIRWIDSFISDDKSTIYLLSEAGKVGYMTGLGASGVDERGTLGGSRLFAIVGG